MPISAARLIAKARQLFLYVEEREVDPPVARLWSFRQIVHVFDENGQDLGLMPRCEAFNVARTKGLALFVVQPDANPPGCRLDYGRFKYEQEKKARETLKKHGMVAVKEIRLRLNIAPHDYDVKLRSAQGFLVSGDKIKVLLILRGREIQHKDAAMDLIVRFGKDLQSFAKIDAQPKMEGKSVIMVLSPHPQRGGVQKPSK
jgi:translation initiation factor IF-3